MKIVKKLSIGFLALVVCFCSCFKFVNAFYVRDFNYSSSGSRGNETFYTPLVDLSFGTYHEYATEQFAASTSFYYDDPDNGSIYSILDDELNVVYQFYTNTVQNDFNFDYTRRYGQDSLFTRNINSTIFFGTGKIFPNATTQLKYVFNLSPNLNIIPREISSLFPYVSFRFGSVFNGTINLTYDISYYNNNDTTLHTINNTILVSHNSDIFSLNTFPTPLEIGVFENSYDIVNYELVVTFITENHVSINEFSSQQYYVNQTELAKIKEVDNFISNYARSTTQEDNIDISFTTWLVNAIDSFMSAEIFPNFSIGTMLAVIVSIPLLIYILRLFMGG